MLSFIQIRESRNIKYNIILFSVDYFWNHLNELFRLLLRPSRALHIRYRLLARHMKVRALRETAARWGAAGQVSFTAATAADP